MATAKKMISTTAVDFNTAMVSAIHQWEQAEFGFAAIISGCEQMRLDYSISGICRDTTAYEHRYGREQGTLTFPNEYFHCGIQMGMSAYLSGRQIDLDPSFPTSKYAKKMLEIAGKNYWKYGICPAIPTLTCA